MDKRAMSIGTLGLLLVSTLYLPLALAEETLVGVVYRGWTEAECKSSFGNQPWITNDITNLNLGEQKYNDYKGPLLLRGQETGCFCGQEKVANADRTTCEDCKIRTGDRNAVYHTNEGAEPGAVVMVNNADIGCRCAKKEENKDFAAVVNGKCTYVDRSEMNSACDAIFGSSVRVCSGQAGEEAIGTAEFQGRQIDCCCEPRYVKGFNQMTQKYFCEKLGEGVTLESALCAQRGKVGGHGDNLIECSESIIKAISGIGTPTQAEKDDANARFLATLGIKPDNSPLQCCCPRGYINTNNVCVLDLDECDTVIPGSVKSTHREANRNYPVISGWTFPAQGGKVWDPAKLREISEKSLECYCREGKVPYGEGAVLTTCAGEEAENVVIIMRTPEEFAKFFEDGERDGKTYFRFVKGVDAESGGLGITECLEDGLCEGVAISGTGVFDFYNEDPGRWGNIILQASTLIASIIAGGAAAKTIKAAKAARAGLNTLQHKLSTAHGTATGIFRSSGVAAGGTVKDAVVRGTSGQVAAYKTALVNLRNAQRAASPARMLLHSSAEKARRVAELRTAQASLRTAALGLKSSALTTAGTVIKRSPGQVYSHLATIGERHALYAELGGTIPLDDFLAQTDPMRFLSSALNRHIAAMSADDLASTVGGPFIEETLKGLVDPVAEEVIGAAAGFSAGIFGSLATGLSGGALLQGVKLGIPTIGSVLWSHVKEDQDIKDAKGYFSRIWKTAAASAGIGMIMGGPALAGINLVIGTVADSINYWGADRAEMYLRWNSIKQGKTTYNLIVSNNMENCGDLKKGSRLYLPETKYDQSSGTLEGWIVRTVSYQKANCGFFQGGGGFSIVSLTFGGAEVSCSGCSSVSTCGDIDMQTLRSNSNIIGTPICCSKCSVVNKENLGKYEGMPSGEGAGPQVLG
jgi:hypothetical protein